MLDQYYPKNIAVLIPNWLGDVAMCTPALRALRLRFPNAHLSVLGRSAPCALLQGFPGVDRFIILPNHLGLREMLRIRAEMGCRPDLAVIFPHSFRAAFLSKLLGAKMRIGYRRGNRAWLLTDPVEPHREGSKITPIYMAREYLDLLAPLGCQDEGQGLSLSVNEKILAEIKRELPPGHPLVAIAPGAAFGPSKCWLPERFAEVADRLHASHGAVCVLLTGPGEEQTRDAVLVAARHPLHVLEGAPASIERLKAVISQVDLFIGNDSGPRHIAIAYKKPVICIMGSTKPAYSVGPWEIGEILRVDVDCGPCQKPVCITDHRCMTQISAEQVQAAAARFL